MKKPTTLQGYKKWRVTQANLPLEELMKEPNCGMFCPNNIPFSGCGNGCKECEENSGYFKDGEAEERGLCLPKMDEALGYRSPSGKCGLPREIMSHLCLRYICSDQSIVQDIVKRN